MTSLKLFLFGTPRIEVHGMPIQVDTRKAIALMCYLAVTRQKYNREYLARFFWGESDTSHARAALRRTLSVLNKALPGNWLQISSQQVSLNFQAGVWSDVQEFMERMTDDQKHGHKPDEICTTCQTALVQAVHFYHGEFLAGFHLADSPAFDEWQFEWQEKLQRLLETGLEKLSCYFWQQGKMELVVVYAQQWSNLDPLQETAYCYLMRAYAAMNQSTAVHRQYQKCVETLHRQLGLAPQPETTQLYKHLSQPSSRFNQRQIDVSAVSRPFQALSPYLLPPLPQVDHHLPPQHTPCLGRDDVIATIINRLCDPFCRLLTVSGPGGVGKTRLAVEVAHRLLETADFHHTICFVPLVTARSADSLLSSIIQALNIPLDPKEDQADQLLQYLQQKRILLLLDNFEQLTLAAPFLLQILQSTTYIKLLVTSRERLNFQAEWLIELQGLSYPSVSFLQHPLDLPQLSSQYSAIQLFLYNIGRSRHNFQPDAQELRAIRQICDFVSGLPLGIELASTLMYRLSAQHIVDNLTHDLDLFTTTMPDIPERHRSLRTVFEVSWQLLSPQEQESLQKLAIFQRPFTIQAAQQVAQTTLPTLKKLSYKSLLHQTSPHHFEIHEIVKQFALAKLRSSRPAYEEVQTAYINYFANLLHAQEPLLKGAEQKSVIELIRYEIEEIHVAWEWALNQRKGAELNSLLEGLFTFYDLKGWFQQGEGIFTQAASQWEQSQEDAPPQIALIAHKLRARQASFAHRLSKYHQAQHLLHNSLVFFRHLHIPSEIFFCLHQLGIIDYFSGNYAQAMLFLNESLSVAQTSNDTWGTAHALNSLGNVFLALGQYTAAIEHFQNSLKIRREIGDLRGIAVTLNNLGRIAETKGADEDAETLFQESLHIKKDLGDRRGVALSSLNLGYIFYRQGKLLKAEQLFQESLTVFQDIGELIGTALSFTNLGNIAYDSQQYDKARLLYENSLNLSRKAGDKRGIVLSLNDLGNVTQATSHETEARAFFSQALAIAVENHYLPLVSEALLGLAVYQVQQHRLREALDIISFVRQQPTNDQETSRKAERLFEQLKPSLLPEPGKKVSFDHTLKQLPHE